jgi:hypothetical protein
MEYILTAKRKWVEILHKREYWDQLKPGRPLIFDNWRILHGRSAFTGNRRICGGYSEYYFFAKMYLDGIDYAN